MLIYTLVRKKLLPSANAKILKHPEALCNMVRRIALDAGELTLKYFDECGYHGADIKGDGSPVTKADREAEVLIEKALKEITPDVPMVGEEGFSEGRIPDLSGQEYFWLVDPVDGTKEFISGSGDYTVNIGLIKNGVPVLGVVYVPALGELYAGYINDNGEGTAIRWLEETDNEKSIHVRKIPKAGMTIMASKSHGNSQRLDDFLSEYKVNKIIRRGSSLKICAVACGKADMYPRLGLTCEWDTAAADAVLRAAGGAIVDLDGSLFRYGGADPKFLNPEFIASSGEI